MRLEDSVLREGEEEGIRERRERGTVRMKMGGSRVLIDGELMDTTNILLANFTKMLSLKNIHTYN